MFGFILIAYAAGLLVTGDPAVIPWRHRRGSGPSMYNIWFRIAGGSYLALIFIDLGPLNWVEILIPAAAYITGLVQTFKVY